MNNYTAIADYLRASAPPGQFTVLAFDSTSQDLDLSFLSPLGAVLTPVVWMDNTFTPADVRELGHYDVVLVPPVLHRYKNWYEYLEAIVGLADIAIFEIADPRRATLKADFPQAYAIGVMQELQKMGEPLADGTIWAVNKNKVQGEEAQIKMVEEILRGFDANIDDNYFYLVPDMINQVAGGLVTALRFHGWELNYNPAITAANLTKVIAANPVPTVMTPLEPERLPSKSSEGWLGDGGPLCGQARWDD